MKICFRCGCPFSPTTHFGNDKRATHCAYHKCQRARKTAAQKLLRAAQRQPKARR